MTRVAVLRDLAVAAGPGQFGAIQTAAPSFGMEVSPVNVRDDVRDRACCNGVRALREWRSHRHGKRVGDLSSRSDHNAGGRAQTTRRLLRTLFVTEGGLIS